MTFGGVEALLISFLKTELAVRCLTDLPADLAEVAPVVQVVRIGGPSDDNNPNLLAATVSIDCFAADRGAVTVLSQQVDDALRKTLPGLTTGGATVGLIRTLTGPSWRPWDDVAVRRFGATYQIWLKTA